MEFIIRAIFDELIFGIIKWLYSKYSYLILSIVYLTVRDEKITFREYFEENKYSFWPVFTLILLFLGIILFFVELIQIE
ncbi:hypothetical protein CEQ90_19775 [Lewinellaceae bacterium SD302]|nr:hypothetical protein CEQ90_19775 [Lewinellaceae bacterium SD302]